MSYIKHMKWRNVGSYIGQHELKLSRGLTTVVADNHDGEGKYDSNGGGKTTLLNIIAWVITGTTPSKLKTTDLINHYSTDCEADLTFSDGLWVERSFVKKEALKVKLPDGKLLQGDIKYIQRRLYEHLGLSASLFASCFYLGRNAKAVQFLQATPAPRAQLLAELIDDEVFQAASELVEQRITKVTKTIQDSTYKEQELRRLVAQLTGDIDQLTEKVKRAEAQEGERVERLRKKLEDLRWEHTKCERVILQKPARNMKEIEAERSALALSQRDLQEKMRDLGIVSLTHLQPGMCSTCLQHISKEAVRSAHERMAELQRLYDNYQEQCTMQGVLIKKLEAAQRELRDQDAVQKRAVENAEYYRVEIAHTEDELSQPPVGRQELIDCLRGAREKKVANQIRYDAMVEATSRLLADVDDLKVLKKAFSSEVRTLLFDRLRTTLAHYTGAYLHEITDGSVEVSYPQSNNLKDKFEIIIKTGSKTQDLSAYSDGESWRLAFAVLLALRATMLQLSQCKLSLLLIDDPIGSLDRTGIQHFLSILRRVVADKVVEQMLITVPWDDVLESTDRVIRVEKHSRASTIAC